ncbi:MAG TPA: M1 family metallopeptidase [Gemmataceae bacterium]|nr:M1 family metallopeptidase [Gemmataceae bacterium]
MRLGCGRWAGWAALLMLSLTAPSVSADALPVHAEAGEPWPAWLPRYEVGMDLDLAAHSVRVAMRATWTNPQPLPTCQLVFNAHSRYVVPKADVGLSAKTLEMLRLMPGETLGVKDPALDIQRILLLDSSGASIPLAFHYEGDTKTSLVVPLPRAVGPGESATVVLEFILHLPPKQGRWGQWQGVTTLSNWLPVFAYYGPRRDPPTCPPAPSPQPVCVWQPTLFLPWHQPFFNESGHYRVRATLPVEQQVACTGSIVACRALGDGRQLVEIVAPAVRDFAFLCSARYRIFEGSVYVPRSQADENTLHAPRPVSTSLSSNPKRNAGAEAMRPVRIRVFAFPEHEHYGRELLRIAAEAITAYSKWFGPYPWPEFTIAESFFGWNGNECSTLVMIDERVFNLPHLAGAFVDSLVSHEICHQWWYNMVGTNGFCETWMDEGLACYFGHRLLDQKIGKNNNMMIYPSGLGWAPNITRDTYRSYGLYGTIGRGENGPAVQPMSSFGNVVTLFSMTYDKGSRIVGLIENRLGSAAFLDFMSRVFHRYCFRILRVADFQRELEAYTGVSWAEFFQKWLYGPGLTDWSIEKVRLQSPPKCAQLSAARVEIILNQKADINEPTMLGIAVPGREGYPIRIPIMPRAGPYDWDDPPAHVEALGDNRVRVEVCLSERPTQIAVDPDQVLVDRDPANNYWKTRINYRVTPFYSFLDETDITTAYDRWNAIIGPWIYGTAYYDAWYPRTYATMIGFRAGLYRTQTFYGGVYGGYRTDYRDVVVGVDGLFDHWPDSHFQVGYDFEQRVAQFYPGQVNAKRGVLFTRYIFKYGSSLYYPPMEFMESFVTFQDNFLPYEANPELPGVRFNETATAGFHYRKDYLTPYWDPVGGFRWDVWYQGGSASQPATVGMQEISSQFSFVTPLPDLSSPVADVPWLAGPLHWFSQSRLAFRIFGGTAMPGRGEFFSMGGSMYFRGFDLAQRQGSSVWVGSVEWRVPAARNLHLNFLDHVMTLHGIDVVPFSDVGNTYISGRQVAPTAVDGGLSLRFDVSWFSFVERTLLRFDVAKTLDASTGTQFWFGVGVPF